MWSNRDISWLFKKVVLECLCDSTKWSIAGVNQSAFIRHAFSSRYKIIRAFRQTGILETRDPSKYPRFGSFKMAYVFQIALEFTDITTIQRSISAKGSSSALHCSSVETILPSSAIVARFQEIMDRNEIAPTYCTNLLPPHSLQLRKQ